MSGMADRSGAFSALAEPPYWMRMASTTAGDAFWAISFRMPACVCWASYGVVFLIRLSACTCGPVHWRDSPGYSLYSMKAGINTARMRRVNVYNVLLQLAGFMLVLLHHSNTWWNGGMMKQIKHQENRHKRMEEFANSTAKNKFITTTILRSLLLKKNKLKSANE